MNKSFILFIFSIIFISHALGETNIKNDIEKLTFTFSEKDSISLKLDKYRLKNSEDFQPCLFFVFGGGFKDGVRDATDYNNYFRFFAERGFTVISIDYRLGMKGQKKIGVTNYKPLKTAIDMAVEDLFDATKFAIDHAIEWKIDTSLFIITGSSSGAIAALQAEYENRNKMPLSHSLPENFQYAGIVSFAGAIFSTEGGLDWKLGSPCPIMLFHGDNDQIVPYNKIRFFKLGFFGSKYIAGKLKKKGYSYYFISFEDASHEIASSPMHENQEDILHFINSFILKALPAQINENINQLYKIKSTKKESYKDLYK